jgi:hypothetical protein
MNVARRRGGESRELVESVALRACGSEGEHTLERDGFVGGRRGTGHCALATWAWLARRGCKKKSPPFPRALLGKKCGKTLHAVTQGLGFFRISSRRPGPQRGPLGKVSTTGGINAQLRLTSSRRDAIAGICEKKQTTARGR